MTLDKQKIVQVLAVLTLTFALILLALFWENENEEFDKINPLKITEYQKIDEKFLYLLEKEYSLNREELKTIMESWSWKTLEDALEEKEIEFKFRERD